MPTTGIACCCARTASGHATAAPPSSVMNWRRLNSSKCIASHQQWAELQDIELAVISQRVPPGCLLRGVSIRSMTAWHF
jgi:hypothetical protein